MSSYKQFEKPQGCYYSRHATLQLAFFYYSRSLSDLPNLPTTSTNIAKFCPSKSFFSNENQWNISIFFLWTILDKETILKCFHFMWPILVGLTITWYCEKMLTLESEIDIAPWINVASAKFDKKNKHIPLKCTNLCSKI